MKHAHSIPEAAQTGLDLFAAAWFERWSGGGGSVMIEADGRAMLGWTPYQNERFARPMPGDMPAETIMRQTEYQQAKHDGKMRELLDLLDAVPGGIDAVKAYVTAWAL